MDTVQAFMRSQAAGPRARHRVFDWNKAAKILKEKNPHEAKAGLHSDLEWTSGVIWRDGKPVIDDYTYLASNWAIPVLVIDGDEVDCWSFADECEFDEKTKWPQSALEIIK